MGYFLLAQQDLTPTFCDFPYGISEEKLTLSVACTGILNAHISLLRGEDIIEDELVCVEIDFILENDDLPVSAVLRLKVVEFQFALVLLVAATINCVVLQIELLIKGYDQYVLKSYPI